MEERQERKYLRFFYDWEEPFADLSGEAVKELLLAMLKYDREGGDPPELNDREAKINGRYIFAQIARSHEMGERARKGAASKYVNVKAEQQQSYSSAQTEQQQSYSTSSRERQKTIDNKQKTIDNISSPYNPPSKGEKSTQKEKTEEMFAEFYAEYPKKQDKERARKAFSKLNPSPELFRTIIAALQTQKLSEDWRKDQGRYIPLPASWLNGARWEDEAREPSEEKKPIEKERQGTFDPEEAFQRALERSYGKGNI